MKKTLTRLLILDRTLTTEVIETYTREKFLTRTKPTEKGSVMKNWIMCVVMMMLGAMLGMNAFGASSVEVNASYNKYGNMAIPNYYQCVGHFNIDTSGQLQVTGIEFTFPKQFTNIVYDVVVDIWDMWGWHGGVELKLVGNKAVFDQESLFVEDGYRPIDVYVYVRFRETNNPKLLKKDFVISLTKVSGIDWEEKGKEFAKRVSVKSLQKIALRNSLLRIYDMNPYDYNPGLSGGQPLFGFYLYAYGDNGATQVKKLSVRIIHSEGVKVDNLSLCDGSGRRLTFEPVSIGKDNIATFYIGQRGDSRMLNVWDYKAIYVLGEVSGNLSSNDFVLLEVPQDETKSTVRDSFERVAKKGQIVWSDVTENIYQFDRDRRDWYNQHNVDVSDYASIILTENSWWWGY